jgi:drug/metabolite transporter (DMT)-like permease
MISTSTTPHAADRLLVLAAALLFSTGGAVIKACGLSSWQVASFRSGIAAVAILLMLPAARRAWTLRTVVVGVAYAATMICYVLANKLTTAANSIFLQSTAPLYILLLSPWLLGERIRKRDVGYMAVLAAGLAMFFTGGQDPAATAPDPLRGNVFGAVAGVCWGLTIMGLRWLARDIGTGKEASAAAVACGNLIACLAVLPRALPVTSAGTSDWLLVVFLGVFQIAVAYVFLTRGMRRVSAFEVSLLLLLEPVLNPIWAWLVHGERPGGWALAGGVLIILATALNTWLAGRDTPPPTPN